MTLKFFIRVSNDCLIDDADKGNPTTLLIFLHNIMINEFGGNWDNRKHIA